MVTIDAREAHETALGILYRAEEERWGMNRWGYFTGTAFGTVHTEWFVCDPRPMFIDREIIYEDRHGLKWRVPVGIVINGASTGWFLRRLFPAYVGFYRRATVLHDAACQMRHRPSWMVHRMFYEAMRCDIESMGQPERCPDAVWRLVCFKRACQAWIMWAAVRFFGPRFPGK